MYGLDYGDFHKGCKNVYLVQNAGQLFAVCPDHKVIIQVNAVSKKVTVETVNEIDPQKRILYTGEIK